MQLYEILNIEKSATQEKIKQAYCKAMMESRSSCSAYSINSAYKLLKNQETRSVYDLYGDGSISLLTSIKYHFGFIRLCNRFNLICEMGSICFNLLGFIILNIIENRILNFLINMLTGLFLLSFIPNNWNDIMKIGETDQLCKLLKIFSFVSFIYLFNTNMMSLNSRSPNSILSGCILNFIMVLYIFVTFLNKSITQKERFNTKLHQVFLGLVGFTQIAIVWDIYIFLVISLFMLGFIVGFLSRFSFKETFIFSSYITFLYILSLALRLCGSNWIMFMLILSLMIMVAYQLYVIMYDYIFNNLPRYYY